MGVGQLNHPEVSHLRRKLRTIKTDPFNPYIPGLKPSIYIDPRYYQKDYYEGSPFFRNISQEYRRKEPGRDMDNHPIDINEDMYGEKKEQDGHPKITDKGEDIERKRVIGTHVYIRENRRKKQQQEDQYKQQVPGRTYCKCA